jgi:hypothetical protein
MGVSTVDYSACAAAGIDFSKLGTLEGDLAVLPWFLLYAANAGNLEGTTFKDWLHLQYPLLRIDLMDWEVFRVFLESRPALVFDEFMRYAMTVGFVQPTTTPPSP